jgi:hypothetical protein
VQAKYKLVTQAYRGPEGRRGRPGLAVKGDKGDSVLVQGPPGPPGQSIRGPRGYPGPEGPQGLPGTGLEIKGSYDTYGDLLRDKPIGQQGDTYIIGYASPYACYIWEGPSTIQGRYKNIGTVGAGVPGRDGSPGKPGRDGIDGTDGKDGINGKTATISSGSNIYTVDDYGNIDLSELTDGGVWS